MRSRQQFRHAIRLANRTARQVGASSASNAASGMNKSTMGATWNAATTPSEWASHGVNYVTNKTTGNSNGQKVALVENQLTLLQLDKVVLLILAELVQLEVRCSVLKIQIHQVLKTLTVVITTL